MFLNEASNRRVAWDCSFNLVTSPTEAFKNIPNVQYSERQNVNSLLGSCTENLFAASDRIMKKDALLTWI